MHKYLTENIKEDWKIIIANNASTDNTKYIANDLTRKLHNIKAVHLQFKGKGNAIKYVWSNYKADVYAFCDVDLSTDISCLKDLFYSILEGNDLIAGSRYLRTSKSMRTFNRLFLSKNYIYLVKLLFKTKFDDFQCGFKAVNKRIAEEILPKVKNKEWFFDTELVILAEQSKRYKIKQIPVKWYENKDTKVKIFKTAYDFISNLIKLRLETM